MWRRRRQPRREQQRPGTDVKIASKMRRFRTWQRQWRYLYLRFVRLQGSPEAIARGLAVGAFAGVFPIFGFQIIMGVLLAVLVRGNKLIAAVSTWISNPFTYVPLFAFNFQVGRWLLQTQQLNFPSMDELEWNQLIQMGTDFMLTLLVGCSVVGIVVAVLSYVGGLWLIQHLRHRHHSKRLKRVR